jgi:hypothetical protein
MPIETIPGTQIQYLLACYDATGSERKDDPHGLLSLRAIEAIVHKPISDVFIISHGWHGDVESARFQYNKWIETMAKCEGDLNMIRRKRPNFQSLIIGLHWPSLAWGDEELPSTDGSSVSFSTIVLDPVETLVEDYAQRLTASEAARVALRTIVTAASRDIAPLEMPPDVRKAYLVLDRETNLGAGGEGAEPGTDRDPFDPERIYQSARAEVSFAGISLGGLLAPLRALTFWKMKDRAKLVGETGCFHLLQALQQAAPAGRDLRFHCVGHSFGCIVVSAMIAGPKGGGVAPIRPVHSLALLQGALSLWSYTAQNPEAPGRIGYFRSIIDKKKIAGCIVTTHSVRDTAVGCFYPLGAGLRDDVTFDLNNLPKYGGVGSFGLQGPDLPLENLLMKPLEEPYCLRHGKIYNLDASHVICHGGGLSGAHCDISRPEVAHALWAAAES